MAKYIFVYRNSFSGECKVFEGTLSHFWQFIIDLAKKNNAPYHCEQFINFHWSNIGTIHPNGTKYIRGNSGLINLIFNYKTKKWDLTK